MRSSCQPPHRAPEASDPGVRRQQTAGLPLAGTGEIAPGVPSPAYAAACVGHAGSRGCNRFRSVTGRRFLSKGFPARN